MRCPAGRNAFILIGCFFLAGLCAAAANYYPILRFHTAALADECGNALVYFCTAGNTAVKNLTFSQYGFSKSPAADKTAGAAISLGKYLGDLSNAGVFFYFQLSA